MHPHVTDIIPRLWWDGHKGAARHEGVTLDLRAAPRLGALHLVEIDFAPAMRVGQIRESAQAWREMTRAESQAAMALLQQISAAAHAAANTTPT